MKNYFLFFLCFCYNFLFAQNDTIIGKVKNVREETIYGKDEDEIARLKKEEKELGNGIMISTPYGEFGVLFPRNTEKIATQVWYKNCFSNYINNYKKFDTNSKLIEELWYENDNKLYKRFTYKYTSFDSISERKHFYRNDKECYINLFNYGELNKVVTSIQFDSDNPEDYEFYTTEYDKNNKISTCTHYNKHGFRDSRIFEYNSKQNTKKEYYYQKLKKIQLDDKSTTYVFDSIGTKKLRSESFYDDQNHLRKKITYDSENGYILRNIEIDYSKSNEIIETRYLRNDTISVKTNYIYNDNNQLIQYKETYYSNPKYNVEIHYFYEKNRIAKFNYKNGENEYLIELKYTFDKKGNWIKQVKFVDGIQKCVRKRKIKYYTK